MTQANDRAAQFKAEIADMKVQTGRPKVENGWLIAGLVLMAGGIALALGAYSASLNVTATPGTNVDLLDSNSYLALAITGVGITIAGGFLFLRYSLARFLRFWLLRQIYEQRVARGSAPAE
jgi:hypothetical protein